MVDPEDELIICTIGTNNRHVYFREGEKPTREEFGTRFFENIKTLYGLFEKANKKVIFMANIPASSANEQDGEKYWRILHMDDINAIYKAASEKLGFPLISMYELFSAYCNKNGIAVDSLLCDGLHPNDSGYDVMFDLLTAELRVNP